VVNLSLVAAKLAELADRLSRIEGARPSDAAALAADRDALDLVSFNLMLAVQAALDVASHIISDEGWEPALTMGGSFQRLGEHGVLTAATAATLSRAAGIRNVVAHGYGSVDVKRLYVAASRANADLGTFAREVAAWVEAHSQKG
jgi:uncharacterized protein YutE (UPF0331/DUF86 family)